MLLSIILRQLIVYFRCKSQFIEQLKVENGKLKFNKISVYRPVHGMHPVGAKPCLRPLQAPKVRTFFRQKQPFSRRNQRAKTRLRPYRVHTMNRPTN